MLLWTWQGPADVVFECIEEPVKWPQEQIAHVPADLAITKWSSSPQHTWLIADTETSKGVSSKGKRKQTNADVSQAKNCMLNPGNQVTNNEGVCYVHA